MPRSASAVGLAKRGVIPRKQFYTKLFFFNTVILEERYPRLKILVSSGYPEDEARKGFPSGSIAGFLKKPYTIVELAEKVRQALEIGR